MIVKRIPVSPLMTNCYILACEKTKEAAIIDAGDEPYRILEAIDSSGLTVKYLVNTHAHVDHVSAVYDIKKEKGAPFLLHKNEEIVLSGLNASRTLFGFGQGEIPKVDEYIDETTSISVGEYSLQVIETPGHSPGGICLRTGSTIFVGDTLFAGSVGRTDLPGGSSTALMESIRKKLMVLDDGTVVYPGHGPDTTIGAEKRNNPFINGRLGGF